MTAGLETFAKVRALHDRTDSPGEKAAAASRMEALARSAGITVAEAVSRLDRAPAQPGSGLDWAAVWEAIRRAEEAGAAADAPEARCWRLGLPIYDPDMLEPWPDVASHCLQLNWAIPKAYGGKFLTKDERARLNAVTQYGPVTNATADWIETVLARCQAAREVWCDQEREQDGPKQGTPAARRAAIEGLREKLARTAAAAKEPEASKVDTPKPPSQPQGPAQAFAESFAAFINRPEFVAERNEREACRRVEAAAIIDRYGSEDALFEDTPLEAALRAACEPLLGSGETWTTGYSLDGWGDLATRHKMPASVREAVSRGWLLPATVVEAWAEAEAADRLLGERCTVDSSYEPHLYVEARRYVVEEMCNTLPALSLNDLRARGAWLAFQADAGVSQNPDEHRTLIATLRADIDRMGERVPGQDPAPVQNGHYPDLDSGLKTQPTSPAQSGHPRRSTRAERHAAIRALIAEGHTDREVARRLAISPTTVGAVRRAAPGAGP